VAVGVVAALASSTAYACTFYKGKMVVTAGGGSTTVVGTGNSMSYCAGYPKDTAGSPGGGAHAAPGGKITISVSPASGCNTSKLDPNTYYANFVGTVAYSFHVSPTTHRRIYSDWKLDCMTRGGIVKGLAPSTLKVPSSGVASGTFTLPASVKKNGPTDASAVCLTDSHSFIGNQAPIIVL